MPKYSFEWCYESWMIIQSESEKYDRCKIQW